MNPGIFVVLGLVVGVWNATDRFPDLGMGTWTVFWFCAILFYTIPMALYVVPSTVGAAGVPIGCLLGVLLGYALARSVMPVLHRR
jgi:hypothetical protein